MMLGIVHHLSSDAQRPGCGDPATVAVAELEESYSQPRYVDDRPSTPGCLSL